MPNVTSSPGSEDGASQHALPDGTTSDLCGPGAARASHSPSRVNERVSTIHDISGRNSNGSSRSDSLQSSLESNLRRRLVGSPSCEVIWKPWVTPWGQSRWKPRARVRNTSEIAMVCGRLRQLRVADRRSQQERLCRARRRMAKRGRSLFRTLSCLFGARFALRMGRRVDRK